MRLQDLYPSISPLTNEAEFKRLVENAQADGHGVPFPTHAIWKDNDIKGGLSLFSVPFAMAWFASKGLTSRDVVGLMNTVENYAALRGFGGFVTPCTETSPFNPVLPKLGYQTLGKFELFYKDLKKGI